MPVSNTYLTPDSGWQQIVVTPAFIRIAAYPTSQPYYVYKGTVAPTTETGGFLYEYPYIEDATETDTFYVRILTSDTPVRIDTFWIPGGAISGNHLILEDGSGGLALEDGSGLIALET